MNILILINPSKDYKNFYHKLSLAFKEIGHHIYYAIDSSYTKFINPIADLDNSPNAYYFDEYFKNNFFSDSKYSYECTWGEFLFSDVDRIITKSNTLDRDSGYWISARKNLDSFFENILFKHDIDIIVYENVSNSFEYSAYRIAKKYNRKYIGIASSRIPGRYELQSSIIDDELKLIEDHKLIEPNKKELEWYDSYSKNIVQTQPDYMHTNGLNKTSILSVVTLDNIKRVVRTVNVHRNFDYNYDYFNGNPLKGLRNNVLYSLKRARNVSKHERYYLNNDEVWQSISNDDYYIYPMHYHPESSTSVMAPTYTDEFNNILNISNNLPFGTFLYVKDHASAAGIQDKEFYEKLKLLPAVKLIHYDFNIKILIQKALGVITINSTAGYEALILGKPVILLGRVFYENFTNVFKASNFHDIVDLIDDIHQTEMGDVSRDIIAYYRYTYEGKLNYNNLSDERFFTTLAYNIIEKAKA